LRQQSASRFCGIENAAHGHDPRAIVEVLYGKSADWMEKVSDEQYQA
jgi:hypothetical protein